MTSGIVNNSAYKNNVALYSFVKIGEKSMHWFRVSFNKKSDGVHPNQS